MRTVAKVLGWLCAFLAAAAFVGGMYLFGVNSGLFAPGRQEDVGQRLLADREFQRDLAERSVDAAIEQAPALAPARDRLVETATAVTESRPYAAVFQEIVDVAYRIGLREDGAPRQVVLEADDLVALVRERSPALSLLIPEGELVDARVSLLTANQLRALWKTQRFADRWAVPLLVAGIVLAIVAIALPGRRNVRLMGLGSLIAVGAALLFFSTGLAGDELARRSPAVAPVIEALWSSAAGSIRAWLGGAFMAGLLTIATGFLVGASHD